MIPIPYRGILVLTFCLNLLYQPPKFLAQRRLLLSLLRVCDLPRSGAVCKGNSLDNSFIRKLGSEFKLHRRPIECEVRRKSMAMFRLDYLSCLLTVVATILIGRKMWTGLVVSGVNSLIVCVIGLHTSQYGFIPANVFCICINAFNLRTWLKVQKDPSESTTDANSELVTGCKRMSKKAATRRLINSFRIRSEGRLGKSISSLAVKGVWPFAPTPLRTNTNVGVAYP